MALTRLLKNIGKPYMQGEDVREAQALLYAQGFSPGSIDGVYGPMTEAAVRAYQKAKGLKRDGIIGQITWGALQAAKEPQEPTPEPATWAEKLVAWVLKLVNRAMYIWGAQNHVVPSEAWIRTKETGSNLTNALNLYRKLVAAGVKPILAFDCSGLVIAWLNETKLFGSDKTANGIYYDLCSAIQRTGLQAGDLVFKKYLTNSRMYHVGVYIGDGTVVHAKGRKDGVVRESLNATGWNRYGRLKYFGSDASGYSRLLKNSGKPYMSGADVMAVQATLDAAGFSPGSIDGVYGPMTEAAVKAYQKANGLTVDGIVGPKTWAKLIG